MQNCLLTSQSQSSIMHFLQQNSGSAMIGLNWYLLCWHVDMVVACRIEPIIMSAGELEHEWAGTPGRLIRERYRKAAEVARVRATLLSCTPQLPTSIELMRCHDADIVQHGICTVVCLLRARSCCHCCTCSMSAIKQLTCVVSSARVACFHLIAGHTGRRCGAKCPVSSSMTLTRDWATLQTHRY